VQDEVEERRPDATRVAARAAVLMCVVARAGIEDDAGERWAPRAARRARKLARRRELRDEVEADALALHETPLGELADEARLAGGWRVEGVAVLAWALSRFDLPGHDEEVDANEVAAALGMADGRLDRKLLSDAELRPLWELERLAEELDHAGAGEVAAERRIAARWLLGEPSPEAGRARA
jgi:hypothetical protein